MNRDMYDRHFPLLYTYYSIAYWDDLAKSYGLGIQGEDIYP